MLSYSFLFIYKGTIYCMYLFARYACKKSSCKPSNSLKKALITLPADYVYRSADAVKLLLDIDYKFSNFNRGAYATYINK